MKYEIYTKTGDKVKVYKTTDIVGWAEKHGFKQTGVSTYKYNPALQGQPTFDGLHGPAWGGPIGNHHMRYEDDAYYKVGEEVIDDILKKEKEGKKESLSREFIKKVEEDVYPADQLFGGGYMPESDEDEDKSEKKRTFGDPWYKEYPKKK